MSFTSKQKEIVARKLGYDGPMQGFDEYVKSSPALEMRYNTVADKYTQRMAQGGDVQPGPVTYAEGGVVIDDNAIKTFFAQNRNNPAALKAAAQQYGVDAARAAKAVGMSVDAFTRYVG